MILIKFIRRAFKILNSETSPIDIGLGFILGMFLGLTPLKALLTLLIFLLFLILRSNFTSMLLALGLFKLLGVLFLDVVSKAIGKVLLVHCTFLAGFWQWLTNLPIVRFLELNDTLVLGGIVLSLILAVPLFLLVKRGVESYRAHLKVGGTKFEKWLKKFWIIRVLKWVFIGPEGVEA